MELREPPRTQAPPSRDQLVRWLLLLNLAVVIILAVLLLRGDETTGHGRAAGELEREVASKLNAAGAFDEAAALYERYMETSNAAPETKAKIAYSIATTHMREGDYKRALRWLYEAETLGAGELSNEVSKKIVSCLERLGKHHVAQAALDSRVQLEGGDDEDAAEDTVKHAADDPVVARIGQEEIYRSDVLRMLDDLPPDMAKSMADPSKREELLKQYVAQELLWRKATKLEYDKDPEVLRRHATMLKQLAVNRFIEKEVVGKIAVDEADLRTYFEANKERYQQQESKDAPAKTPAFEEVRQAVERDYRMYKIQAEYGKVIESELSTAGVELHPERLAGDA